MDYRDSAFPIDGGQNGEGGHVSFGLSKRDYFAAKAMQALIAHHGCDAYEPTPLREDDPLPPSACSHFALLAYYYADAMIKAREVKL